MKNLLIFLFLILLIITNSFNYCLEKDNQCFEIYLLKNNSIDTTKDIDEIILDKQPLISNNDIISYNWKENIITISDSSADRILDISGKYVGSHYGIPTIITINKKFIYKACMWSPRSPLIPPTDVIIIDLHFKKIIYSSYNKNPKRFINENNKLFIRNRLKSPDSLSIKNKLIYDCLKASGKLIE